MKKQIGDKKKPDEKTKQKGWFRRHLIGLILTLILIGGAGLLAYPTVANYWNQFHQTRAVMDYVQAVDDLDEEDYEAVLQSAYDYNRRLAGTGFNWRPGEEQLADYANQLNINDTGIMGYVNIPKINVMLPIYHGIDEAVLQIAIGHLEASSLPVGCESFSFEERRVTDPAEGSHTLISGHRGLPSARLFTDLDQLVEGDQFSLTVLNETMTYEIDQIRIVEPSDLSELQLELGQDYCTLITCTPYGINTHRLLVRGHRVQNTFDDGNIKPEAMKFEPALVAPLVAAPILLILLILLLITTRSRKKDAGQTPRTGDGEEPSPKESKKSRRNHRRDDPGAEGDPEDPQKTSEKGRRNHGRDDTGAEDDPENSQKISEKSRRKRRGRNTGTGNGREVEHENEE